MNNSHNCNYHQDYFLLGTNNDRIKVFCNAKITFGSQDNLFEFFARYTKLCNLLLNFCNTNLPSDSVKLNHFVALSSLSSLHILSLLSTFSLFLSLFFSFSPSPLSLSHSLCFINYFMYPLNCIFTLCNI